MCEPYSFRKLIAGDQAGYRWPGYLSDGTFGGEPIKFADMPGGTLASAEKDCPIRVFLVVCGVLSSDFRISWSIKGCFT